MHARMRVVKRGGGALEARPAGRGERLCPGVASHGNCRTDKHSGWLRHQATGVAGSVFPLR
ncbi:hypothetical protein GCM10010298_18620 [Streptomyces microflavus]|nr:hypothetical protein GCM10010298_18620 [Streptomyces microflavus]